MRDFLLVGVWQNWNTEEEERKKRSRKILGQPSKKRQTRKFRVCIDIIGRAEQKQRRQWYPVYLSLAVSFLSFQCDDGHLLGVDEALLGCVAVPCTRHTRKPFSRLHPRLLSSRVSSSSACGILVLTKELTNNNPQSEMIDRIILVRAPYCLFIKLFYLMRCY